MAFDSERFEIRFAHEISGHPNRILWACITFINQRGGDLLRSGPVQFPESPVHRTALMEADKTRIVMIYGRESKHLVAIALMRLSYDWRRKVGEIEHVLVDPDFRGQGLGNVLVAELIAQARNADVGLLKLTCERDRTAARAVYEGFGFQLVEGSDVHFQLQL